ncbi:hypothetical protein AYM40_32570 [Paraburkholderia phytofirmans OLGA172]|uniref:Uncharacterized protein n=1 Tax=Paraburkholderia phytofirmans OLGA172 TaxID=1417228 RepID=A0A160FV91_9BURK|nr:hypothetical protein AYM40_32570 [Paraburkholderia phytofirmans OLGA172]
MAVRNDRYTKIFQFPERLDALYRIPHDQALRDLQLQRGSADVSTGQRCRHVGNEVGVIELPRREIDADLQWRLCRERPLPVGDLLASLFQYVSSERNDEAAFFCNRNELGRRQQTSCGVLPPHERFHFTEPCHLKLHDRLKIHA